MERLHPFPAVAYVFDKDGTLIDTESLFFEAFDRLLSPYGVHHDLAMHAELMGASVDTCVRMIQVAHPELPQVADSLATLKDRFRNHVVEVRAERGVRPMAGAQAFLEHCRRRGIRLGLATSAGRESTEADLVQLGWREWFEVVVTSDDVARHKPAPDIYLKAAGRLSLPVGDCLAFEDGIKGTQSANTAGMPVVFVRDERFGISPPAEANMVIASFAEFVLA